MLDLMKHKLESRLLGEISIIFRYADDNTLMAKSKKELKILLIEKTGLKTQYLKNKDHGLWSHHFMANR